MEYREVLVNPEISNTPLGSVDTTTDEPPFRTYLYVVGVVPCVA